MKNQFRATAHSSPLKSSKCDLHGPSLFLFYTAEHLNHTHTSFQCRLEEVKRHAATMHACSSRLGHWRRSREEAAASQQHQQQQQQQQLFCFLLISSSPFLLSSCRLLQILKITAPDQLLPSLLFFPSFLSLSGPSDKLFFSFFLWY